MEEFTRVNRPVSAAGAYYNRLAPWYDFLAASEKKFIKKGLDLLQPKTGEKILEIGFGTGFSQLFIAPAVGYGLSIGLDISQGMCLITQKKASRAGISDQIKLIRSNTLPIPFQGEVFDGIFSSFTLELFDSPQIPLVLKGCQRVLKTDGRFVLVSLSKDQPLPVIGKLYEKLHERYPTILDCRPIPTRSLISAAGFKIEEYQEHRMWGLPISISLNSKK